MGKEGAKSFQCSTHFVLTIRISALLWLKNLSGDEKPAIRWLASGLLILLLHVWLIDYLHRPAETVMPAQPFIMKVSLIAASAPKPPVAAHDTQNSKPKPPISQKTKPKPLITTKPKTSRKPGLVREPMPAPTPAPAAASEPQLMDSPPQLKAQQPAAPAAKAPAPKTETFIEANYRANYGFNPKPEYPRIARSRGWQGKVLLRVQVSSDGASESIAIQRSSGHPMLDDAAAAAVKKWKFIPAKRGDKPVASSVIVPIQFTLHD
jgi:protein TonB